LEHLVAVVAELTLVYSQAMADEEEIWLEAERTRAQDYLREQRVEHLGVGEYPTFQLHPYLALWAVQSKRSPGSIGWWIITGDLPADYISGSEGSHPRDALRAFARHWLEVSNFMLRGEVHPDYSIGTPDRWPKLGDLLRRRAEIIQRYADDNGIWTEDAAS
jgi:hypothetical protein